MGSPSLCMLTAFVYSFFYFLVRNTRATLCVRLHWYHPRLKMCPGDWHDYGYASKASDYSYFDDAPKKRCPTRPHPLDDHFFHKCTKKQQKKTNESAAAAAADLAACRMESERRAGKLLVHELMHIYGLEHCVYHACVMNGTGHLVEDFNAPSHLCPVDLRKMQWRLGFSVAGKVHYANFHRFDNNKISFFHR